MSAFYPGEYRNVYGVRCFQPAYINQEFTWNNSEINVRLAQASQILGELKQLSEFVPDVDFFVRMHVYKEATRSSQIEGTRTEIDEALLKEEDVAPTRREDWKEVQNYVEATNYALQRLTERPLSIRIITEAHSILLQGVRGEGKSPGEFRRKQNWIGGGDLETAQFVPPHPTEVEDLLGDLERFWHNEELALPSLIKVAISHYQFETIHPFLDGNGRMGRLLMLLQMIAYKHLTYPTLYLSEYFERYRSEYFARLDRVRNEGDLEQWIFFFLQAVIDTAHTSKYTLQKLIDLQEYYRRAVLEINQSPQNMENLIEIMFSQPRVSLSQVQEYLNVSKSTASRLLQVLEDHNFVVEVTGYSRNRIYELKEYMDVFRRTERGE